MTFASAARPFDVADPQIPSAGARATALLDADDLAARWKVSKAQVYRLAREGKVPSVQIGRYYRFRLDAIERWEEAQ